MTINDANTMDRILADDFVLVTGSGKTYSKADLIADARSGNSIYEKNDELEKKVRVWGDTAVVTVKVWEKGRDASPSTICSGSATPTFALRRAGATSSASLLCRCPKPQTPSNNYLLPAAFAPGVARVNSSTYSL